MAKDFPIRVLPESFKLPKPGAKGVLQAALPATDSLALTDLASRASGSGQLLVLICSEASAMLRLAEEISWLNPALNVRVFPDWETLPYDTMSPHEDLVSERLETLWRLTMRETQKASGQAVDILIASAATASQRIAPPSFIAASSFLFTKGQRIAFDELKSNLVMAGYGHVDQVMAPGEFCVRGSIIDVFPMGSSQPFRLDLFDDELDNIRLFDPETQRSVGETDSIRILSGHEFPMDEQARTAFRARWRETFKGDPAKCPAYVDIGSGIASAGIEYYLPLFFESTSTLVDYIPESSVIVTHGDVNQAITSYLKEINDRYRFVSKDIERPVLPPQARTQTAEEFFVSIGRYGRLTAEQLPAASFDLAIDRKAQDPAHKLKAYLERAACTKSRVLITATSQGRTARLGELLREDQIAVKDVESFSEFLASADRVCLGVSPLSQGVELSSPTLCILTETELYAIHATKRKSRIRESAARIESMIRDISELKVGDPVVHVEHGIGRYQGLQTMATAEGQSEFVRIDYAADAKLFVPVSQLHMISRYTGTDAEHAPLHSLGRGEWERAKKKAAAKVRDTAAELLHLYALRESRQGFAFAEKIPEYQAFCEGFEFDETPDQATAIAAVLADMLRPRPMDRLVCGDVGFGKTEVALRAAFVAVMNGRQVAVLCPTTLLAEQHAQTFRDRFAAWPVTVAELSRFRSGKETNAAIAGIKAGSVDIVIGTHKLLSEKIEFARLGLVVIDEEHRFGVRQKERLKSLRAEVDVLTLTATPIPRTLAMSLEGIRDFSVIATAPEKRLAIKTFVRRESDELIREAVIRELKRGGQVYFLHNEVETINNRLDRLEKLLPEARIGIAHGQMAERDLERVMRDFYQQRYNVLLCTTIIETGIDNPNANTIIMHRADKFGLAQLHQLRGRVGRSHHQAYAYLLTPGDEAITKNAQKRLDAIQNLEDLGSGFYLSMHDLEIRGAGEVLGDEQSGEMQQVGFDLYSQMLKTAVDSLKKGEEPNFEHPFASMSEINLHMPALLPEDFVPDVGSRLSIYKKLAATDDIVALEHVIDDINDRFGKLPEPARALIATHRLRLVCRDLGIKRIDAADSAIVFIFNPKPKFEPINLIKLLQTRRDLRMMGPEKMRLTVSSADLDSRVRAIRTITNALGGAR